MLATVFMVLVYLYDGSLVIEKTKFETIEACAAAGVAKVAKLELDPHVDDIRYGECIEAKAIEVKS